MKANKIIILIIALLILNLLIGIFLILKDNNYTYADLIVIKNHIMEVEGFELNESIKKHYDLNNDGKITSVDYVKLYNKLNNN